VGLNPKGPIYNILNTVEECRFFFDQLLKVHNLKYLPTPPEETTDSEQKSSEKTSSEQSKEKQPSPVKKDEKTAAR